MKSSSLLYTCSCLFAFSSSSSSMYIFHLLCRQTLLTVSLFSSENDLTPFDSGKYIFLVDGTRRMARSIVQIFVRAHVLHCHTYIEQRAYLFKKLCTLFACVMSHVYVCICVCMYLCIYAWTQITRITAQARKCGCGQSVHTFAFRILYRECTTKSITQQRTINIFIILTCACAEDTLHVANKSK